MNAGKEFIFKLNAESLSVWGSRVIYPNKCEETCLFFLGGGEQIPWSKSLCWQPKWHKISKDKNKITMLPTINLIYARGRFDKLIKFNEIENASVLTSRLLFFTYIDKKLASLSQTRESLWQRSCVTGLSRHFMRTVKGETHQQNTFVTTAAGARDLVF